MSISAVVDTSGLDAMIAASEAVDSPEQIRREAAASVPVVENLYVQGFERSESPSGEAWAAPKHDYGHPLMRDTRELQGGAMVTAGADGVTIVVADTIAEFHQDGTKHMEAREIVPRDSISERWERQIGLARANVPPRFP